MIVLVAGMYRSGSTFAFNIAREMLAANVRTMSANGLTHDDISWAEVNDVLIKSHNADENLICLVRDGRAKCIITYRRPDEAVASWMETFGATFDDAASTVQAWLEWHRGLKAPALYIPYELIEKRPRRAILSIQRYLNLKIDRSRVARLAASYSKAAVKAKCDALTEGEETINIGFSYYDRSTFFHRKHVSSINARLASHTISPAQIEQLNARLAELYMLLPHSGFPLRHQTGYLHRAQHTVS